MTYAITHLPVDTFAEFLTLLVGIVLVTIYLCRRYPQAHEPSRFPQLHQLAGSLDADAQGTAAKIQIEKSYEDV